MGGFWRKPSTSNSLDPKMIWRIFSPLQKEMDSSSYLLGKELDFAVMARTCSPNASWATFSRNVESTPLEKATAREPNPARLVFNWANFWVARFWSMGACFSMVCFWLMEFCFSAACFCPIEFCFNLPSSLLCIFKWYALYECSYCGLFLFYVFWDG